MRKPALLVPLVLVLGLLGGCTGGPGINCTAAGATSGVVFHFDAVVKDARPPVRATACVEGRCIPVTLSAGGAPIIVVDNSSFTSVRPVTATLTVFEADRRIFNASTTVLLHKFQPNGPDCPPAAYVASVTATAGGDLRAAS